MTRIVTALTTMVLSLGVAEAQQLQPKATFATETRDRTRLGGAALLGDALNVIVQQSSSAGAVYVALRMEYQKGKGIRGDGWTPIPARRTRLGKAYRGRDGGVRAVVEIPPCKVDTLHKIRLFMPYAAADLTDGRGYFRRYSLDIWCAGGKHFTTIRLPRDTMDVETVRGVMRIVCRAYPNGDGTWTQIAQPANLRRPPASVRGVNLRTSRWASPEALAPKSQTDS